MPLGKIAWLTGGNPQLELAQSRGTWDEPWDRCASVSTGGTTTKKKPQKKRGEKNKIKKKRAALIYSTDIVGGLN